ncbi:MULTISPECIES: hypothetical protein [Methylobacterium]|uniref:hypothetical protein n=1 Tax=Methylobacterium TaxID=407 RepID=UPI0013EBDC8D|nr:MULTISPECIES: hypothetical protein [unclassified Methylobacterium]NGM38053.1 hypothetical protein [Methylobacterium sp. DB0501]
MNDGSWVFIDNLTANTVRCLAEHPLASQGAVAVTLAAGCYVALAAPAWALQVTSDRNLAATLCLCGLVAGACLFTTGLFYESLLMGASGAITCMLLVHVYYAACMVVACGAMAFAGVQIFCALHVRPAPLLRATIPGVLGAWLFALSVPVYQVALILRGTP